MRACFEGYIDVVTALVNHDADVNAKLAVRLLEVS